MNISSLDVAKSRQPDLSACQSRSKESRPFDMQSTVYLGGKAKKAVAPDEESCSYGEERDEATALPVPTHITRVPPILHHPLSRTVPFEMRNEVLGDDLTVETVETILSYGDVSIMAKQIQTQQSHNQHSTVQHQRNKSVGAETPGILESTTSGSDMFFDAVSVAASEHSVD